MFHQIVLASTSPSRRTLLERAGIAHVALAPRVDEDGIRGDDPVATAALRARAKALDVAGRCGAGSIVIGADQVVHLDGEVLSKPREMDPHRAMLRLLRGRTHELVTAVAVLTLPASGAPVQVAFTERTRVKMRADLSDGELDAYVATGEGRMCAGGYQVEDRGILLFDHIDGDWTNVMGLPMPRLIGVLRSMGWRPFDLAAG